MHLMLSCEHATNAIPARYRHLFDGYRAKAALRGHRGCDIGALELAERLRWALGAQLFVAETSRLLIDVNRSLHHQRVFSEFSSPLSAAERLDVIDAYYRPYRRRIQHMVEQRLADGDVVLHISVHSFTPRLDGRTRNADVGLLYDSKRRCELQTSLALMRHLKAPEGAPMRFFESTPLRVRRNYPYRGTADGLTTALRRRFTDGRYRGIELEINQRLLARHTVAEPLAMGIASALKRVLDDVESV